MVSKSEQKRIDALKGDDTAPIALLLKRLRGQRVDSETADPEGLMLVAADEIERLAGVNQLSIQGCRWQHIDDARELAALRARVAEAEQALADTLDERDQYHEMADKLADAIAAHFGEDIGEHSNLNCPWTQALELIESRASASAGAVPE